MGLELDTELIGRHAGGAGTAGADVHAVLVVTIGSTTAELPCVLRSRLAGVPDPVPSRIVVIDSLPYPDLVKRLEQNGWPRQQIEAAIPRSHYLELESPFTTSFDFANPLNAAWQSILFEPALEQLAAHPSSPGCAGTPALGRARAEASEPQLRNFFERHLQELLQIRVETVGLAEGVRAFVHTTFRGGTGTGASMPIAAVLRSAMGGAGEIHLRVAMPCIYRGDDRAIANAYAALRECCACHSYRAGARFHDGQGFAAPFDTVSPVFVSNGATALGSGDVPMDDAALLLPQLRARTQAAYNARIVDLTDVLPHDVDDRPMHVRIASGMSIRTIQAGTLDYVITAALRQHAAHLIARVDAWARGDALSEDEARRVDAVLAAIIDDCGLDLRGLLRKIDTSPASANELRLFFEQIATVLGSMKSAVIKRDMAGLPDAVRQRFAELERAWEEKARLAAAQVPAEIIRRLRVDLGTTPHLLLAALGRLRAHFAKVAVEAEEKAAVSRRVREEAGQLLARQLQEVQQASGFLRVVNRDEVTRDAARRACDSGLRASLARSDQQRLEAVARLVAGPLSAPGNAAGEALLAPVAEALAALSMSSLREVRLRLASLASVLDGKLDQLGQQIDKRSLVFQRSLLFDTARRADLDREARGLSAMIAASPEVVAFVARRLDPNRDDGEADFAADVERLSAALVPLLPTYGAAIRRLSEVLEADPAQRAIAVQLLRARKPFAQVDREVEAQQGLANRRDTLEIFEVPGGRDGAIGALLLREGVARDPNQIVEAVDDEIRVSFVRDGLPYAALRSLRRYRERHDSYLAKASAVTPYTHRDWHGLPSLEPSRTNVTQHVGRILAVLKAVRPERVAALASGGVRLAYEQPNGDGVAIPQQLELPNTSAAVMWLAKQVVPRKFFERELKAALDGDPTGYGERLLAAWRQASTASGEKAHLGAELLRIGLNPYRAQVG